MNGSFSRWLILAVLLLLALPGPLVAQPEARSVFSTAAGASVDQPLNRMWNVYGRVVDGAVARFGNEPEYYEWMALKLMWSGLASDKKTLREKMLHWPQTPQGYIWSWEDEEGWPTHHGRHYVSNARYILGVYRYVAWSGESRFLHETDDTTVQSDLPGQKDASRGRTVLEKARRAMAYQLEQLNGRDGLVRVEDPASDGTVDGKPTDYWDNFRFGHLSAYLNIYFYASLHAMAKLEETAVEDTAGEYSPNFLRQLRSKVKERFNRIFWSEQKGRYIGAIDAEGKQWDFGFTYLNTEAMFYGLVPGRRARRIYEWLDGERTVKTDIQVVDGRRTGATGEDIYAFEFAPRSTTRAAESIKEDGEYWWWSINGQINVGPGRENASWGMHLENGGAIFYTSFYDVVSRLRHLGAERAWARFSEILDEFAVDELRRDPANELGAKWKFGITGEFPESGLVPAAVVHGFMGASAAHDTLTLDPRLPTALPWLEIHPLHYHGRRFAVRAHRNEEGRVDSVKVRLEGPSPARLDLRVENLVPNTDFRVEGRSSNRERQSNSKGEISVVLDLKVGEAASIEAVATTTSSSSPEGGEQGQ
jgi:hypothetical protein